LSMESFIQLLSKYLDMPSVQSIMIALRMGQERYSSGKINERDVDSGARKLCRMISGTLGTDVSRLESEIGSTFSDWCVNTVKMIVMGSLAGLTASSAIDLFKSSEESEGGGSRETRLL